MNLDFNNFLDGKNSFIKEDDDRNLIRNKYNQINTNNSNDSDKNDSVLNAPLFSEKIINNINNIKNIAGNSKDENSPYMKNMERNLSIESEDIKIITEVIFLLIYFTSYTKN